jgi:hypothetical protein
MNFQAKIHQLTDMKASVSLVDEHEGGHRVLVQVVKIIKDGQISYEVTSCLVDTIGQTFREKTRTLKFPKEWERDEDDDY